MERHGKSRKAMITVFCWVLVCATFQGCFADVPHFWKNPGSSLVLPLYGDVNSIGRYWAKIGIGSPPKAFNLQIDTGSFLTWVECRADCKGCTEPCDRRYMPHNNFVPPNDTLCAAAQNIENHSFEKHEDQCDFGLEYADGSTSCGVLAKDNFSLEELNDGSPLSPALTFGCASDVQLLADPPSEIVGILGLGNHDVSIVSQLSHLGKIRNVLGHCLSARGGGFVFIGDHNLIHSSEIAWVPLAHDRLPGKETSGPAELLHDGTPIGVGGLEVVFDSGSTSTYLNHNAYQAVLNQVRADLKNAPLEEVDQTQSDDPRICWKRANHFSSVNEVKNYFKPLALNFTEENVQLHLPPEAYLAITDRDNACLCIGDGSEKELGELNVIGDISMQDKMVIYDYEEKKIGWVSADCNGPIGSNLFSSY